MSLEGSQFIVDSLAALRGATQAPDVIDRYCEENVLANGQTVMTSMGHARSVMLLPYFPGIQLEHRISTRLFRAEAENRPFVEALIRLNKNELARRAAVTLRLKMPVADEGVQEATWMYPLERKRYQTTWQVVSAIGDAATRGEPVAERSGIVMVTPQRLEAGNWAISQADDPTLVAIELKQTIAEGMIDFTVL